MHVAEQSWRKIKSTRGHCNLRLPASCTFRHSLVYEATDALQLHGRNDGPNVDGLIQRRTDAKRIHAVANFLGQRSRDTFLHEQARAGAADLSLVEPDPI